MENRPFKACKAKKNKEDKENIYIIDTNVFLDQPEIISKIDHKYSVVLSAKVIDELDKFEETLPTDQQNKMLNLHHLFKYHQASIQ